MAAGRHTGRNRFAIFAALALVLQLAANATAAASNAATPAFDIFGNPLCITSVDGGHTSDHHTLPACCVLGCAGISAADLPPPVVAPAPVPVRGAGYVPSFRAILFSSRSDYMPGRPRAPPFQLPTA